MTLKEYGGYIELEYAHGSEFYEDAIALNSGRHCLEYLIRAKKIRKLYLPCWLCNSVKNVCIRLGIEIAYYHVNEHFFPVFEGTLCNGEWLYVVNYYGQLSPEAEIQLKEKYENIVFDHAQAFFASPVPNADTLYTCRKYFGVTDGGYLFTDTMLEEKTKQDVSYDRMTFLLGRLEKTASEFYSLYSANNKLFSSEPMKSMSKLTHNLLRGIDYQHVIEVRTNNFASLHEQLNNLNKLSLTIPNGAFMYPLYIENGSEIRRKLQEKKIYIPTLWTDSYEVCSEKDLEYDFTKNILPLPVDQRYDINAMRYIVNEICNSL